MSLAPLLNDGVRPGDYVLSEAEHGRSRDNVVLLAGAGILKPGRVLGKITASGKFKAHDPAAVDGSEVAAGVNYALVDASGGADVVAVAHVRDCQVKVSCLSYAAATDTAPEKAVVHAALAALGIIVR